MNKSKYSNPSGFPEHLPEVLHEEMRIRDVMRRIYESFGYVAIETPAIEKLSTLASKGEIGKEIYTIRRALGEGNKEDDRALRFDLTVPLARYVAQHFGQLQFPFKRWQIQKVWRGERPQAGRFREFYQADIDVVGNETLPIHFDAEVVLITKKVLEEIDFGEFTISINHRKLLQGILEQYGIKDNNEDTNEPSDLQKALRAIDKYDKVGQDHTIAELIKIGLGKKEAEELMKILEKQVDITDINSFLDNLDSNNSLLTEGINELREIAALITSQMGRGEAISKGKIIFNPRIARGLDYYTGSVYETTIDGLEKYGSICSGGRYADLAGKFTNKHLPGVGLSIGLTRLMHILEKEGRISPNKKSPTKVYIALLREEQRLKANAIADSLREASVNTQVAHNGNQKLNKQFKNANNLDAEYVIIINEDDKGNIDETFSIKRMSDGISQICDTVSELIRRITEDDF